MKKTLSILLVLMMVLGLGGTSFAAEVENQELNIAIFEGGYGPDYWNKMVELFEAENPGVTVNMQISPDVGDIIRPQIVAGNVSDFLSLNDNDQTGVLLSLIKERGLLDITDVFDGPAYDSETPLRDIIVDGVLESAKCSPYGDGKIYIAPFNMSPMGLIYNETLFAKESWDVPVTWDQFFALGDVAKEAGTSLITYPGIHPGYVESMLFPAIASAAGMESLKKITSYAEGAWTSPEVMGVLENIAKIGTGGYLMEGTVGMDHTQTQSAMMMDQALFIPNGNWIEGEMAEAPRTDGFVFALTPPPVNAEGDTRYVMSSVEQFSIPAQAKNPELAKKFLRFLYTQASVIEFASASGGTYAVKGVADTVKDHLTPGVYAMNAVYDQENVELLVVGFDAVPQGSLVVPNDEIFQPIADIMNGTLTAQQWAENMEAAYAQVRADLAAAPATPAE